ncbi:CD225/dispanin family protein [Gordonia sp. (in: high G+C Gram-positive bacteria)]|uniref:CD225/dispanin family protein n=1 Tax=Gordonia sp. (in: high G+C Gram-positive bacteria) TaxID=84139 RepID=UPI0039E305A7
MTNPIDPTNPGQQDPTGATPGAVPDYTAPTAQPYAQQYGQPAPQPYAQPYASPYGPPPNSNLVMPIISAVLGFVALSACCGVIPLVLGILGIVKSNEVTSKWAMGDHAGAVASSEDARKFGLWGIISVVVMAVIAVIAWIIIMVVAANSGTSSY